MCEFSLSILYDPNAVTCFGTPPRPWVWAVCEPDHGHVLKCGAGFSYSHAAAMAGRAVAHLLDIQEAADIAEASFRRELRTEAA